MTPKRPFKWRRGIRAGVVLLSALLPILSLVRGVALAQGGGLADGTGLELQAGGEWQTIVTAASAGRTWTGAVEALARLELRLDGDSWRADASVVGTAAVSQAGPGPDWRTAVEVERLSLRMFLGDADVTLGRQQVSWGVGYAWSPTDVFAPIDPTDPGRSRPSVDGIAARVHTGPLSYWTVIAARAADGQTPGDGAERRPWRYGARWHGNVRGVDASLAAAADAAATMIGADVKGDAGVLGWHVEAARTARRDGETPGFLEAVLGADVSWGEGRFVAAAEYLYDSGGAPAKDDYDYASWLAGARTRLARHYAFGQITWMRDDFTSLSGSAVVNLVDASAVCALGLESVLGGNWRGTLSATALIGDEGDEFCSLGTARPHIVLRAQVGCSF